MRACPPVLTDDGQAAARGSATSECVPQARSETVKLRKQMITCREVPTFGPWPWPREMESTCALSDSAYFSSPAMGSDPGDSTKIRGVKQVLSW